jgi:hypothetical protein
MFNFLGNAYILVLSYCSNGIFIPGRRQGKMTPSYQMMPLQKPMSYNFAKLLALKY